MCCLFCGTHDGPRTVNKRVEETNCRGSGLESKEKRRNYQKTVEGEGSLQPCQET